MKKLKGKPAMHFMDTILPILVGREIGKMKKADAQVVHEVLRIILGEQPDPLDVEALACAFIDHTIKRYVLEEQRAAALRIVEETGREPDYGQVRRLTQEKLGLVVNE